jgi:hypothetical protein
MQYELRSIPEDAPEAHSYVVRHDGTRWALTTFENERFTDAIYQGARMIFRFRRDALEPIMGGASFADRCLARLTFGPKDAS